MPTKSEIARDWGVDPSYITRLVKRGMPLDSFEAARLWRKAHANKRDPTGVKATEEATEDEYSPEARERRRKEWEDKPEGWQPGNGTLEDALKNSIRACDEAYRLLQEAMIEGRASKISVWMSLHNRALEGRVKVERLIREEMERQKILVPMIEAQTSTRKVVEIVVSRLASLPQNLAHACNPSSPDHAFEILQRECTSIVADTQKAIA
jgi:hypothetical protein